MKFESYYTAENQKELVFKYCGYEECSYDFVMNPHTRSEYLIHYITQGSGVYLCENQSYPIKKGDAFAIFPSKLVSYYTSPEDPLQFAWFAFSGEKSAEAIAKIGFSEKTLVRKIHKQYTIHEPIQSLLQLLEGSIPCNDFHVQSMFFMILSKLADSYSLSSTYIKNDTDIVYEHIMKAKTYIKYNYIYPITVMDIVKHVGLERSYFSKIFTKYTGTTVQKYLSGVRIEHSKYLLERTNYSIKEISSYVGISDEFYFSRLFKQYCDISPLRYRKSLN